MTTKRTPQESLNLYQKLVKVRERADYIKKDSQGYSWKYADECAILSVIRSTLDAYNIWVDQEMEELETIDITIGGKISSGIRVKVKYHIIDGDNPQDSITRTQYMIEPGVDCKKVGSILTYANRYFWFKFLQIPQSEKEGIENTPPIQQEELVKGEARSATDEGKLFLSHFDESEKPALDKFVRELCDKSGKKPTEMVKLCLKNMERTKENYESWKLGEGEFKIGSKTVSMTA